MKNYVLLLSTLFISQCCIGQSDSLGRIQISVSGGVSLPLDNYKNVTLLPEEGGSATNGFYTKLGGTYWLGKKHLGVGIAGGFYQHPFSNDKATLRVSVNRDPTVLEADPWRLWSLVPNLSVQSKGKVDFRCHAGVGLAIVNGWDVYVEWFKVIFPAVTTWEFPTSRSLCMDAGASIEIPVSKRFAIGLEASMFKTGFKKKGTKDTITYDIFIPGYIVGGNAESPKSDIKILSANFGLSFSMRLQR